MIHTRNIVPIQFSKQFISQRIDLRGSFFYAFTEKAAREPILIVHPLTYSIEDTWKSAWVCPFCWLGRVSIVIELGWLTSWDKRLVVLINRPTSSSF